MVAEVVAYYKSKGKTIFQVLAEIYEQFGFYKESLISVTKKGKDGAEQIQQLMRVAPVANLKKLGDRLAFAMAKQVPYLFSEDQATQISNSHYENTFQIKWLYL